MSALPTGVVTFVFTDIEGSTRLLQKVGAERYAELLERHSEIIRRAIRDNDGFDVGTQGDAFFAAFPSVRCAVAAAADAQRGLAEEDWPRGEEIRVRIGLHTGEARAHGDTYVGIAVHEAARVGDVGHGGQVLLSSATAALVEHDLPAQTSLRDLGEVALASFDRPRRLYQLDIEGLVSSFPRLRKVRGHHAPVGPPLLERQQELDTIERLVDEALASAGCVVAIEGEAGIGKTRLVAAARAIGEEADMQVLSARGGELEHGFSYGVVRQLFEPLLATATPEDRDELLAGAAKLAQPLFEDAALTEAAPGEASFSILHGLFWLVGNLALRAPLMLAVDDLHWADAASLRWLSYLARRLEGQPVIVVAGLRPPEQGFERDLLAELTADPAAVVLRPAALSLEAAQALIREALGTDPHPAFAKACREATAGNPLFLRALLIELGDERMTPTAENAARVYRIGPQSVSRAVHLRLARLPAETVALARALAILGDDVALHDAAQLAGLEREMAAHAATTLARNGIVHFERALQFVHPVVRASIYGALGPLEREAAHGDAARLLAESGAPPERVAAHLMQTPVSRDPLAVVTLRKAADQSLRRGDPGGAVAYLLRALSELPPEDDERAALLYQLGLAERLVNSPAAAKHLEEALALERDTLRRGAISLELGRSLFYGLRLAEAVTMFEGAIAEVGGLDDDLRRRLEAALLSMTSIFPPLFPIAEKIFAVLDTERLGTDDGSRMLLAIASYHDMRQMKRGCVELAERAVAGGPVFAEENPTFIYAAYALLHSDRFDQAFAVYDDALAHARRSGSIATHAIARTFRAHLDLCVGRLPEGLADAREGLEALRTYGLVTAIPYGLAHICDLSLERGDLEGAAEALETLDGTGEVSHLQWFWLDSRARLRLAQGRPREALDDIRTAAAQWSALGGQNPSLLPWRSTSALAHHALGQTADAERLWAEELELAREWGAARSLGRTLRIGGLIRDDLSLLQEAVDVLDGTPAQLERAKALVDYGAMLRRRNQRSDSREFLRQGIELAHACDAVALEEWGHHELMAAGARPRRVALSGVDSLTASERRVATMAAEGMTNREIAQALFVTPKTVEVHLSSAYRKLGISSRSQLAATLGEREAAPAA